MEEELEEELEDEDEEQVRQTSSPHLALPSVSIFLLNNNLS